MKKFTILFFGLFLFSSLAGYDSPVSAAENAQQETVQSGWVLENGNWYYYDEETGMPVIGWLQDEGKWYYLDRSGAMVTGWAVVNDRSYLFNGHGVMQTGWILENGRWLYFSPDGNLFTGWVNTGGQWYYSTPTGMATGWVHDSGKWYYMKSNGVMHTGWLQDQDKWYYLKTNGEMGVGWLNVGGKTYYMGSSGAMASGWKYIDGNWHHFEKSGQASIGWKLLSGSWYYFVNDNGMMAKNQLAESYYLMSNGKMSTAGSKAVVEAVESLKKSIKVGITKEDAKKKLGNQYSAVDGQHNDSWHYYLSVASDGKLTGVQVDSDDAFKNLGEKKASILVSLYWKEDKAFKVTMHYFDASHKAHYYSYIYNDYQYY